MEITNNVKSLFLYKVGWVNTRWSRVGSVGLWDFSLPSKQFVFAPFTPPTAKRVCHTNCFPLFTTQSGQLAKVKLYRGR